MSEGSEKQYQDAMQRLWAVKERVEYQGLSKKDRRAVAREIAEIYNELIEAWDANQPVEESKPCLSG